MQRFVLTFFFIILSLGQQICQAQENPNPANSPMVSGAAKQDERPTQHHDTKPNNEKTQKNFSGISPVGEVHNISVEQSSYELAEKANIFSFWQTIFSAVGLVLIGFATWFAWGAWRAGKDAVEVTRDIGQKQVRGYSYVSAGKFGQINNILYVWFTIKNLGQSPLMECTAELEVMVVKQPESAEQMFGISEYERLTTQEFNIGPIEVGQTNEGWRLHFDQYTGEEAVKAGFNAMSSGWRINGTIKAVDVFGITSTHTFMANADREIETEVSASGTTHSTGKLIIAKRKHSTKQH